MASKSTKNGAYEMLVAMKDAITRITGIITPKSIKGLKNELGGGIHKTEVHPFCKGARIRFPSNCDIPRKVLKRHQQCRLGLQSPSKPRCIRVHSPCTRSECSTARTARHSTQRRADGICRLPWLARSGKRNTALRGGQQRAGAFIKTIYQFW